MAFEQFFYQNPTPCWIMETADFRFMEVNISMIETYGYSENELLRNKTFFDLCVPEDVPKLKAFFSEKAFENDIFITRHINAQKEIFEVQLCVCQTRLNGRGCWCVTTFFKKDWNNLPKVF